MVVTAVRGALGFLTRLPVGHDETAWEAFRRTPTAFPLAAYPIGALIALPVGIGVIAFPAPVVAFILLVATVVVTGINHADGVADLGDAAVVHGDQERRRAVMKDTIVGVGAVLALGIILVGLALAGLALAGLPPLAAVGIVVAAEVGAKLGMTAIACLAHATHEGLGSAFTDHTDPSQLFAPAVVAVPALALTGRSPAALVAVLTGLCGALVVLAWARQALGGVNGDVFGGANEIGRVLALHAGVVAWTLS
jgi:adenosylcobinamide-GDP ribazoletransferase